MTTLHFNFKDMFQSIRLAFNLQRIWIQFVGLLGSYTIYLFLTYLAFWLSGEGLAGIWDRFGLLPMIPGMYMPIYCLIIYGLAVFALVYGYMITATGVSRAVYMNLKGNTFYTWKESLAFAWKKKLSILGTPLSLAILIVLFILGGGFIGLIGKIAYFGELFVSLFSLIWFLAALFLVFISIALIVSVFLTPAILATTDDDAFEGIFQSFSIAFTQPWRLLFYQVLNVLSTTVGFLTFALLIKYSWKVLNMILNWGMGDKFVRIATAASYYLQSWTYPFVLCYKNVMSEYGNIFFFTHDFTAVTLPSWSEGVSAIILAIFLVLLGGYVVSFPLAIFNTGHVLGFLAIKKIKDDENLLERKDREEEEDEEEDAAEAGESAEESVEAEKPVEEKKKSNKKKKKED
ncbi:hypothetical protein ACFL4L_01635 [bacterium]